MRILILNGPNLNMLGQRETEHYGKEPFTQILGYLQKSFPCFDIDYFQSNHEGALIDKVHEFHLYKGIVVNAGALSHYSYALHDALKMVKTPKVEVHMSNIYAREPFRHHSVLSAVCNGTICGFGKHSYALALTWLKEYLPE
ncbi:MAG: type II 3-dehydroquinate dehydratase [Bacteroidetes bacterium]|nr:type II 3-dehydroquinate dehydratase [Bacteroidota bacterium]